MDTEPRPLGSGCCLVLALILLSTAGRAEIIDRISVTVGNRVITQTEILREIRMTAFLNQEQPEFSQESKRKAADRLVEQKLMRNEIELSRYPQPSIAEADQLLADLKKVRPNYEADLKRYGITEEDLRRQLLWQLTTLRFIEMRFRPGTRVTEEEIREEFERRLSSEANRTRSPQPVNYQDVRDQIEQRLIGERTDKLLDNWLKEARTRTRVQYRPEAFQ